jgi:hypothetical protein
VGDPALAGHPRELVQERLADTAPLVCLPYLHLGDEELRGRVVPARKVMGKDETDRLVAVERDEEDRALVLQQLEVRLSRRERPDDVLVARPEPPDLDQKLPPPVGGGGNWRGCATSS